MELEGINHRTLHVNGINMHIAEKGEGPVVLFLHGFPELWYTWRHQIPFLASHGYHAVAPDLRGYGDTDSPADVESYTIFHIVGDLIALINSLGQDKVFVVGHDWGAIVAWNLCLFRPDRVKALVNLSVPFSRRNPVQRPVESFRALYGDYYYVCRFQEPGEIEAYFARIDTKFLIKMFLAYRKPDPVLIPKEQGVGASRIEEIILPSWLSENDISYFADKFKKSGFTGGFNYYRNYDRNWELTAPFSGVQIEVPVKFIIGDVDMTYHIHGAQDYIHKGGFKQDVPLLEEVVVMEGVGHFINQEKSNDISQHIFEFIKKF